MRPNCAEYLTFCGFEVEVGINQIDGLGGICVPHRKRCSDSVHLWGQRGEIRGGMLRKLQVSLCIFGASQLICVFRNLVI
jgi:hypothetical protein